MDWFDLEDLELADASDVTFDLSLGAYGFLVEEMIRTGAWWVRPFARDASRNLFGLRLGPGASCHDAPVVMVPEGSAEARTVASRAAAFVPTHVWRWLPHEWDAARALEEGGWTQLVRLHRALGGIGALEDVRALVRDERLRDLLAISSVGKLSLEDRQRRLDEVRARLDGGPGAAAFHEYVTGLLHADGSIHAPVPWPAVGAWTASTASLAFRANHDRPEAALGAAWELMNQPPGLDGGRGEHAPFDLAQAGGPRLGLAAARTLVAGDAAGAWRADPLWPAVEALAAAGDAYDGAPHLAAADALERHGDPARAFVALTAAAYHSFHAEGASSPEALDAAIALTRRNGPEALLEHLEVVASCRAAAELTDLRRSVVSSIAAMMVEQVAVVEAPTVATPIAPPVPTPAAPPATRRRSAPAKAAKKKKKKKVAARKKQPAAPKKAPARAKTAKKSARRSTR